MNRDLKNCQLIASDKSKLLRKWIKVHFLLKSDLSVTGFFIILELKYLVTINRILQYIYIYFFNYYLAAPRPTSGHYRGDSLTHPMLITAFVHVRPEGHREPRSEVGSLSPAERLAGF